MKSLIEIKNPPEKSERAAKAGIMKSAYPGQNFISDLLFPTL